MSKPDLEPWANDLLERVSSFLSNAWAQWSALVTTPEIAPWLGILTLLLFVFVVVYKHRLVVSVDHLANAVAAVDMAEARCRLAQRSIEDLQNKFNPLHPYGSGIVEDREHRETTEVDSGIKEEFVLEIFGRVQSMHNDTLECIKQLLTDNNTRTDELIRYVSEATHEQQDKSMLAAQRLVKCIGSVLTEPVGDEDEDED